MKINKLNILIAVAIFGLSVVGGGYSVKAMSQRNALTDKQKEALEEIRELRRAGDIEGAKKLAEENNLPEARKGKGPFFGKNADAVRDAIEKNDYNAFISAIGDHPEKDKITEAVFAKIVEAHNLRISGKVAEAQKIMNEIGLGPIGRGMGRPMLENLSDEERVTLEKARELFESGDRIGAKNLMKSIRVNSDRR